MLLSWRVSRFKSVYRDTHLDLTPLTVFAGANSAGKSTVIQSILLTAQSLRDPVKSRSVLLNGALVKLGTYEDVESAAVDGTHVTIGFSLDPDKFGSAAPTPHPERSGATAPRLSKVACDYAFSSEPTADQRRGSLYPALEEMRLRAWIPIGGASAATAENDVKPRAALTIRRARETVLERRADLQLSDRSDERLDTTLQYAVEIEDFRRKIVTSGSSSQIVGTEVTHFLPQSLTERYDAVAREVENIFKEILAGVSGVVAYDPTDLDAEIPDRPLAPGVRQVLLEVLRQVGEDEAASLLEGDLNFSAAKIIESYRSLPKELRHSVAQALLSRADDLREGIRNGRDPEWVLGTTALPPHLRVAAERVVQYFAGALRYLGPLRERPRSVYPLAAGADTADIGTQGEYTAAVLDTHRDTLVEYVPTSAFSALSTAMLTVETRLVDAVDDWLRFLGVGGNHVAPEQNKFGHSLRATSEGGHDHDIGHFGVGVSQVLPILVMCLLAGRGSTLIIEQPEVHLNPRAQSRLSDFFLSMTHLGKQCIVETHSEHLIHRLRYRASTDIGTEVAEAVLIYFVENSGNGSQYRPIKINEFGVILEWPAGFFDEGEITSSAILRAGLEKRKRKIRKEEPRA